MKTRKSTKRALLLSVCSIMLCLAMLIGTTFAWFTDTASTAVNQIQAGTLDIDIIGADGNSLDGKTLSFRNIDGSADILWEPGVRFNLDSFRLVNKGNLALKYKVIINGIDGDSGLLSAIDFTMTRGTSEATVLEGWEGILLPSGKTAANANEEVGQTELITISGHMNEGAGNEYQGKTLNGVGLTIVATQYTYEFDSNGNQYDAGAQYPVTNDTELSDAIEDAAPGATVVVAPGKYAMRTEIKEGVTIAGSGKDKSTLNAEKAKITNNDVTIKDVTINGSGSAGTAGTLNVNGNNTTLENVDFKGDGNIAITVSTGAANSGTVFKNTKITNAFRGIQFWSLSGDSLIDGCTLDVAGYTFNIDAAVAGSTLTLRDSVLNGWTSYTSGIALVAFDNCKLGRNTYEFLRPYSETTLTDCEFTSAGYRLNAGGTGAYTITLTNCTKNGTAITAENVQSLLLDLDGWNPNATLIVNGTVVTLS